MASRWSLPLVMALASGCAATATVPSIAGRSPAPAEICPPVLEAPSAGNSAVPMSANGQRSPSSPIRDEETAFARDNPLVVTVGEPITLKFFAYQSCLKTAWGVLETDRAQINQDGRLTAIAAGSLHVYLDVNGRRRFTLIAAIPAKPEWTAFGIEPPALVGIGSRSPVHIRSADEWQAYWRPRELPEDLRPALPADCDFSRQMVLAIPTRYHGGFGPGVLTEIIDGPITRYRVTEPTGGHAVNSAYVADTMLLYVVNKRLGPAQVEVEGIDQDVSISPVEPASGATPTPSPTSSAP